MIPAPPFGRLSRRLILAGLLPVLFLLTVFGSWTGAAATQNAAQTVVNRPIQITSRTDAVLDMAISPDGQHIVYISGEARPDTLWLASADPTVVRLPEKLVDGPSAKSSPAISADGRFVAYVNTDFDVKGDIYLIDRDKKRPAPVRLTGRATEDGGPCFSNDGRWLYFHQATGNRPRQLVVLDLKDGAAQPQSIESGGDAAFCALSADNHRLAFVSSRKDVSGDIFILDRRDQSVLQITSGPAIDMFPRWHPDGRSLYFSRIGSDTNHDQRISSEDHSVIYRIRTDDENRVAYPITPLNQESFQPYVGAQRIYYLSGRGGISNCWALPEEGVIHMAPDDREPYATAERIARQIPYDPYQTLLAWMRVMEIHGGKPDIAARAGYKAAGILQELALPESALEAYRRIQTHYRDAIDDCALSAIKETVLVFHQEAATLHRSAEKRTLLDESLNRLDQIAHRHAGTVAAEASVESVALRLATDPGVAHMAKAIDQLAEVLADDAATDAQKARSLYLTATIYKKTAAGSQAMDTWHRIVTTYPQARKWVDRAVEAIIDQVLTDFSYSDRDEKIRRLNQLAAQNRTTAPAIAMGAFNRIGDLYYEADEWALAKAAYQNILDAFPILTTQTAAARLSLAEIHFREESFRKAIDLYEKEITLRDRADQIYQLARQGYIQKNISAGAFHFRLGEIPSARSLFKELIDYDDRIVQAHRGYIQCAAASGDIDKVLADYRAKLQTDGNDPVWRYCTGLCLTYRNNQADLREAKTHIEQSIRIDGGVEYYHQTLGYIHEVLETVYGKPGQLEYALVGYQKAYFLNDPEADAENAAHLVLNLGNIYYLLGQYGKAYQFYSDRDRRQPPFPSADAQLVFLKRLGESAFQTHAIEKAIDAFTRAVERIDGQIDPLSASKAFDRLNRYAKDRIIDPAMNHAPTRRLAEKAALRQSEQNLKAAALAAKSSPPPSPGWSAYKQHMLHLIDDQKAVNTLAVKLADAFNATIASRPGGLPIQHAGATLDLLTQRIGKALDDPERLMMLQAELLDRLALAYQENSEWEKAAETFQRVFAINEKSGQFANLARNRRAVAYATYHLAQQSTGAHRIRLLREASDEFSRTLALIDRYGIPEPKKREKQALLDVSVTTALDAASATQAAGGFTKDQEIRLAETFVSRIQLELGNVDQAQKELDKQLIAYPSPDMVKEKDRYGVSLLTHRSGLMDSAGQNVADAFDKFAFSATLCLMLENPVSAAMNLTNMAAAGEQWIDDSTGSLPSADQIQLLALLDKKTTALLSKNLDVIGLDMALSYHNQLGLFYFRTARRWEPASPSIETAVVKVHLQQQAVRHFVRGISLLETNPVPGRHDIWETATRLYLNLAAVSGEMGDDGAKRENYATALAHAETGVLPDLAWRALAGLNRLDEALAMLAAVPLSRAGCAPMEIIDTFGPLVAQQLANQATESALHVAERLSELERFHRTARFVVPQDRQEKTFFSSLYPRLARIRKLTEELATADADHRPPIEDRLADEKTLLDRQLGPDDENLPLVLKKIKDRQTRELATFVLALSQQIETAARDLAAIRIEIAGEKQKNPKREKQESEQARTYDRLTNQYRDLVNDAFSSRPLLQPPDFITWLAPEPFDVLDLAEVMGDEDAVARIFRFGGAPSSYAVFLITKEETTAFLAPTLPALKEKIDATIDWVVPYIAYEDPQSLDFGPGYPYALSAKHLQRCFLSKNPFTANLLAVPPRPFPDQLNRQYTISSYPAGQDEDKDALVNLLAGANTLVLTDGPVATATVPTKPGVRCRPFMAVRLGGDHRMRLETLLADTANLSLSIVGEGALDDLFLTGHLFSIYGCPAVMVVQGAGNQDALISRILTAYARMSGIDALSNAAATRGTDADPTPADRASPPEPSPLLIYLGYRGMAPKAAAAFAKQNFVHYVKAGRAAFDRKAYGPATVMFANAVAVATDVAQFDRYLPDLYKYARESAYRSGDVDVALRYAEDLAELMAEMKPDTKAHAEALLRLGLLYSKKSGYDKAIAALEEAISIMSRLEADEDLVVAFMDLGIVLENATHHDTALSRFNVAADLSRELNLSHLLAEQYLNMGRIYDLRLNQYATAIGYYEKALAIYSSTDDVEKIGESKLNIGRCYRLLGNFSQADADFAQSLALIGEDTPAHRTIRAKILIEQANNAWFQGRYEEAFTLQRQCHHLAEQNQLPLMQVIAQNTEGLIWWTLGDYAKAIASLESALSHTDVFDVRKDEMASTLNNIGLVYRDMGDHQKALDTFQQAVAIDAAIDSKWGLAYDYRNQGLTYLKLNAPQKAADLFDRAYEMSNAIGNRINAAKAILGKGDALLSLQRFDEAETAYQGALDLSLTMSMKETQWRSLFGLAKIRLIRDKDRETAEALLRRSIDVIENLRSDIKITRLKENFLVDKLAVYEALIRLLADKNQPVQAFQIAERSRARNFIDLMGSGKVSFASDTDRALYRKQQVIRSEIEKSEALLAASDAAERPVYETSLQNLRHELQNLAIEMQLANPQLASMVSVPPVDPDRLIGLMEPGTALLSYYLLDQEVFCWILRPDAQPSDGRIRLVRIPVGRSVLETKVLEYRRIIQNIEPYDKHSADLYNRLIAPVIDDLDGVHTIGISPHGSLHYLSFATLANADGFLVDRFALFYTPSAAVLEYTLSRRRERPYRSPRVLAVGNPDLGDPILDLPFSEQEVDAIRWNFPDITILKRTQATENKLIAKISTFDIIHIASHGALDPVNPLLSAIKLALPEDKTFTNSDFDGNLEAGEIFGLSIHADMVFLSACQTGLGKINAGDDVVGLNRSFFFAGTHTVISSLWRVSDVSTAVMTKAFYRLYMNQNKADCLRQAALHVKTRFPHPGYWGAFTLVGDYY